MRICCVPNCLQYRGKRLARFPNVKNKSLFEEWIRRVNHPNFSQMTMKEIHKKYYVCSRHFAPKWKHHWSHSRILKKDAIPTLFLLKGNFVFCFGKYFYNNEKCKLQQSFILSAIERLLNQLIMNLLFALTNLTLIILNFLKFTFIEETVGKIK